MKLISRPYIAKQSLYTKLNDAESNEVSTKDAEAVYNNPNATPEEIYAAVDKLAEDIFNKYNDLFLQATPDNPADATFLIQNADFSQNTSGTDYPGWEGNFSGWQQSRVDGPAGGTQIKGPFVEQWVASPGKLGDFYLQQQLNGLPAGLYTLGADITARQQSGPSAEVTGCHLFAQVGDAEKENVSCSSQAVGDNPVHYELNFYVKDGENVLIGFETKNTTANWVAFDNFKLTYYGNAGSVDLINLELALSKLNPLLEEAQDEDDKWNMSEATAEAAKTLVAEAGAMDMTTSTEDLIAMTEKVDEMVAAVTAEMEAYKGLRTLQKQCANLSETYADIDVVGDGLGELGDFIADHLEEGDLSMADIEELWAKYNHLIHEELAANIKEGTDLTALINNPNFDNNSADGWEAPNGWTNIAAGCAEQWNCNFDVYQDITNLPKGRYEVGLKGFYRQGGWSEAMNLRNSGQEHITAYVYGESGGVRVKTAFNSIFEGMLPEENRYIRETDGVVYNDDVEVTIDGVTGWIPDGMAGFAHHVNNYDQYYFTATLLVLDGNLRIGAMNENHNEADWVIFDSFTLKYVSDDMSDALLEATKEEAAEMLAKRDDISSNQPLPTDIYNAVDELVAQLDAVDPNSATSDEIRELSQKVTETSEELDKVAAEAKALLGLYTYYETMLLEVPETSDPEGFQAKFGDIYANYTAGPTWETTEDMRAEGEWMKEGWVKYLTADVAKQEVPVEVSDAILNRGFYDVAENSNSNIHWSIEMEGGANTADFNEQEFYNNDSFNIHQTIKGLPAGFYEATVQGFYRPGWNLTELVTDTVFENHAQLYATVGENTWTKKLMYVYDDASSESIFTEGEVSAAKPVEGQEEPATVYFPNSMECAQEYFVFVPADKTYDESNPNKYGKYRGNSVIFEVKEGEAATIGVSKDTHTEGDWCIFDDFQLFYLGVTIPDAISTVAAGKAVEQKYYTIGGVQLARPQKGVNIVTTTLSDGSKVTTKVLVK